MARPVAESAADATIAACVKPPLQRIASASTTASSAASVEEISCVQPDAETIADVGKLFALMDVNQDGVVSAEDFGAAGDALSGEMATKFETVLGLFGDGTTRWVQRGRLSLWLC